MNYVQTKSKRLTFLCDIWSAILEYEESVSGTPHHWG